MVDAWKRKREIMSKLESLYREIDNFEGETIVECVIDQREEEGLPPMTEDELAAATEECDRNAEERERLWDEVHALTEEYCDIVGAYPVVYAGLFTTVREPFSWEISPVEKAKRPRLYGEDPNE